MKLSLTYIYNETYTSISSGSAFRYFGVKVITGSVITTFITVLQAPVTRSRSAQFALTKRTDETPDQRTICSRPRCRASATARKL